LSRTPEWNWLQAVTRLITNISALVLLSVRREFFPLSCRPRLYLTRQSYKLLIDWLVNAAFHAWICAQFLRYQGRRRTEQFS
jgi:hypothetical protein